jgi:ribose/xylose/arabinose/galactoside ABC-type transport system permease subunit
MILGLGLYLMTTLAIGAVLYLNHFSGWCLGRYYRDKDDRQFPVFLLPLTIIVDICVFWFILMRLLPWYALSRTSFGG